MIESQPGNLAVVAGIDIDGVLADPSHRLHYLDQQPKNWRGFFNGARQDPPLTQGVDLVRELRADDVAIVYVTGRPEYLRPATRAWLRRQGLPAEVLHMRPPGDFRPAPAMKLDVYRAIAAEFEVRTIVDDDLRVVKALRAAGFPVRWADWFPGGGQQATTLRDAQDVQGRT